MKAIIFAAGKGTRLKPFTDSHPKALAPVGDKPILAHVIEKFIAAGVDGIVINVHHFASQITDFLDSKQYPVKIEISDERACLLETGGALAKIARESALLSGIDKQESIFIHNSDILTDFKLKELMKAAEKADGAILADPSRQTSRKFLFSKKGWLRGWTNESSGAVRPSGIRPEDFRRAAFGGVHCIHRPLLDKVNDYCGRELRPFSIVDFYIDRCTSFDCIKLFTPIDSFHWHDIGTAEHLAEVQNIQI